MKTITYLFPIHNEEGNIELLYKTVCDALKQKSKKYDYELIFINDGSTDKSLSILKAIAIKDKRVRIINFARNFGHQIAVTAGMDYSRGDAVIVMDSDLQDPPAVSLELIEQWEKGYDIVYAKRRTRKDSVFKKFTANVYYRVLKRLSNTDMPTNIGDFRLMDRRVVDALNQFREHDRYLRGLVSYVGFNSTSVLFDRDSRFSGKTSYPLSKMIKLASDGIVGFSDAPLKLILKVGYFISLLSLAGIIYALVEKIFFPKHVVSGWTFTAIAMLLIGGIQLVLLGVIGNYIGRIYTESQNRPLYIIESITNSDDNETTD